MWDLNNCIARWDSKNLVAEIDTKKPANGVHVLRTLDNHSFVANILQLNSPQTGDGFAVLKETYTRGQDVIASYNSIGSGEVRSQIYWSYRQLHLERSFAVGFELTVSRQTNLLDSDPSVSVMSAIQCDDVWVCSDVDRVKFIRLSPSTKEPLTWKDKTTSTVHLFRLPDVPVTYVQIVNDCDLHSARVVFSGDSSSLTHCETKLFDERLEKGVIRRGRMWGMFVPRQHDFHSALLCLQQVSATRLPLTT